LAGMQFTTKNFLCEIGKVFERDYLWISWYIEY
jgi:hypothetical protein